MIRAKNRDGRIIHISETSAHRPRSVTGWVADRMIAATAANSNKDANNQRQGDLPEDFPLMFGMCLGVTFGVYRLFGSVHRVLILA